MPILFGRSISSTTLSNSVNLRFVNVKAALQQKQVSLSLSGSHTPETATCSNHETKQNKRQTNKQNVLAVASERLEMMEERNATRDWAMKTTRREGCL
jgi:hypothetical protein